MRTQTNKIDLDELEVFIRLIEAQRELVYHLQKHKEATEQKLKEVKFMTAKAQEIVNLRNKFRSVFNENKYTISDEERKKINNILQSRHIKI